MAGTKAIADVTEVERELAPLDVPVHVIHNGVAEVFRPVAPTASHPGMRPLGWEGFARAIAGH